MAWIYVPEAASEAPASRQSDCAEPSATSSGTGTANDCCSSGCATGGSPTPAFGTTCDPSTDAPGLAAWISSLGDRRVSHSRLRESEEGATTPETLCPSSYGSSERFGPGMCYSRTCPACSLPPSLLAYVAGLLDGEGSLTIFKTKMREGEYAYFPGVIVEMSEKAHSLLKRMQEMFGGTLTKRPARTRNRSPNWVWRMRSAEAMDVIWHLTPYLLLKRVNADLLHELAERVGIGKNGSQRGWTKESQKTAEELKQRMHGLNRKGPKPLPSMPPGALACYVDGQWVTAQLRLDGTSEPFLGPFPKQGTLSNGVLSARTTWAPRTAGRGSGCWPTPVANDDNKSPEAHLAMKKRMGERDGTGANRTAITSLQVMAKAVDRGMFPTPATRDHHAQGAGMNPASRSPSLATVIQKWPTPKGSPSGPDFARSEREGSGGDDLATAVARETWATPRAQEPGWTSDGYGKGLNRQIAERGEGGALNPDFVAWLMGWPLGWDSLDPLPGGGTTNTSACPASPQGCPTESTACGRWATGGFLRWRQSLLDALRNSRG